MAKQFRQPFGPHSHSVVAAAAALATRLIDVTQYIRRAPISPKTNCRETVRAESQRCPIAAASACAPAAPLVRLLGDLMASP